MTTEYNLTKCYIGKSANLKEEQSLASRVNDEPIKVTLEKESKIEKQLLQNKNTVEVQAMNKIKEKLIRENKLSKDNPLYVIKAENIRDYHRRGVITLAEAEAINDIKPMAVSDRLRNKKVPIGTFHVSKHAKLNVDFHSSDSLKVDVGVQNIATGAVSCSGSRERGIDTESKYAPFTTTLKSAKKTYYTMADFEEWTVVPYYGLSRKYVGIKQINGGTETGSVSTCSSCSAPYDKVVSSVDYGTYIPISSNSSVAYNAFRNKTVNLGVKVSVSGSFSVGLGVSRRTGSGTKVTYSPKSGYKLKIYNKDTNTWHCTDKAQ